MNPIKVLSMLRVHKNLCIIEDDMWWTTEDIPAYQYLKRSNAGEMEHITPHLRGNKVAVQAGAHCGYTIRQLEPHFEHIYCFEPDPTMFLALCLNLPNPNIHKMQACVGLSHGGVTLVDNAEFPYAGARWIKGFGNTPVLTIDDLALGECDLIMLDVEGHEYNALLGAQNTIKECHPVLCVEIFWGHLHYKIPRQAIFNIIQSWGYTQVGLAGESDYIFAVKP